MAALVSKKPLTSDIIFPAIALFMLLQFPLAMVSPFLILVSSFPSLSLPQFSQVTSNIIESIVSIRRMSNFLAAAELQPGTRNILEKENLQIGDEVIDAYQMHRTVQLLILDLQVLVMKDGEFWWSSKTVEPTLRDITLSARKGDLIGVLGRPFSLFDFYLHPLISISLGVGAGKVSFLR
jgi:ATP-binding cassette subfamily C (CFTR/MRP) protein 1